MRGFLRRPIFPITTILSLALGIGLNAGIFVLLDTVVWRPYPVRDASAVVNVYQQVRHGGSRNFEGYSNLVSYPEYRRYRAAATSFENLAAYKSARGAIEATPSMPVQVGIVSCNYFETLRVRPQLGRLLAGRDCDRGENDHTIVLSDRLWRSHFGASPAILGTTIRLRGTLLTVVGVAEPSFDGLIWGKEDVWIPITVQPAVFADGRGDKLAAERLGWLSMVGRLRPDVDRDRAQTELAVVGQHASAGDPGRTTIVSVTKGSLFSQPAMRSRAVQLSVALLAVSGVVLLIVCTNLLGLLSARSLTRRREVAVRFALGATRRALIGQFMIESIILGLIGGTVGLLIASAVSRLAISADQTGALAQASLSLGPRVIGYVLALSVLCAFLFGLLPALQATGIDLAPSLRSADQAAGHSASQRFRRTIVTVEVAGCYLLLALAALFLKAVAADNATDIGIRTDDVVAVHLKLDELGVDSIRAGAIYEQLMGRLRSVPGVEDVALTDRLPFDFVSTADVESMDGKAKTWAIRQRVSPEYFRVLGVPLLTGRRLLEEDERSGGDRPVVISEHMAETLWPTSSPIGKRFRMQDVSRYSRPYFVVVGVAKNGRTVAVREGDPPILYEPIGPTGALESTLLVRASPAGAKTILTLVPSLVHEMDPTIPVAVGWLSDRVSEAFSGTRLVAYAAGALGLLAVLLAAIGIYGVVNYSAVQRSSEFGVRMALGASPRQILWLAAHQGMLAVAMGLGVGVGLAVMGAKVMRSLVHGVSAVDPLVLGAMSVVVIALGGAAIVFPIGRMLRGDPTRSLRTLG
jgi:putative ABC transport system permease protein